MLNSVCERVNLPRPRAVWPDGCTPPLAWPTHWHLSASVATVPRAVPPYLALSPPALTLTNNNPPAQPAPRAAAHRLLPTDDGHRTAPSALNLTTNDPPAPCTTAHRLPLLPTDHGHRAAPPRDPQRVHRRALTRLLGTRLRPRHRPPRRSRDQLRNRRCQPAACGGGGEPVARAAAAADGRPAGGAEVDGRKPDD